MTHWLNTKFDKIFKKLFKFYKRLFSIYRETSEYAYLEDDNFENAIHYAGRYILLGLLFPLFTVSTILLDLILPSLDIGTCILVYISLLIVSWILASKVDNYLKVNMLTQLKAINNNTYSLRQKTLAFLLYFSWVLVWGALIAFYFMIKYNFSMIQSWFIL